VVTNALRLRFFQSKNKENSVVIQKELSMETVIGVNGMMCPHCQARVEAACKTVSGVQNAVVDLQKKNVTVTGNASVADVKKAITDAGYEVVE
jgi:Cu+-exporting ATPase